VGTTLKATAREVDSFAGRATGSRSSTVAKATNAADQVTAPPPRPATGAAPPAAAPTVKRGAPAVTSPVRRAAPSTRPATARPLGRVAGVAGGLPGRGAELSAGPLGPVAGDRLCPPVDSPGNLTQRCATLPLRGAQPRAGLLKGALAPMVGLAGPVLRPVGSALAPIGTALAPVIGPVGGLLPPVVPGLLPLPGLGGAGTATAGAGGLRLWLPSRGSGASCLHPLLPR
jgi:hypothetical protein